jgi:hypothetical protein
MQQLISDDCHVIEPPSTWIERMPARLRDRAPRVVKVAATRGLFSGNARRIFGFADEGNASAR